MSMTGFEVFDRTVQKSTEWLEDIRHEMGFSGRKDAYRALRAALHGLRDCLTPEEAAHLGAQLPMLIRGLYYEGWNPAHKPVKGGRQKQIFSHIHNQFQGDPEIQPEEVSRAVFKLLSHRISQGEIEDILNILPEEARALFPRTPPSAMGGKDRGSDAERIRSEVAAALSRAGRLEESDIAVTVTDHTARLSGTVPSYTALRHAEQQALKIAGVRTVESELSVVVPTERVLDKTIAQNVISALELHPEIPSESLDVTVSDGVVTLSGAVPTRRLYDAALDVTRYTKGVINIEDKILVG